jgi:hypothetical protein
MRLKILEPDTFCARYRFASSMIARDFEGDGALLPLIIDVVLGMKEEETATVGGVR